MAIQVSDNTPQLGHIAWSGVHIVYLGVDYAVQDGSTDKKYVYWDFSVATTQFQTSDLLPDLDDEDVLIFYNRTGIHVTVPTATVTDGDLIVPGSVLTAALAANCVTTEKLHAGAVVGEKIAAGEVNTLHLAALAVTAEKCDVDELSAISANLGTVTSGKLRSTNYGPSAGMELDLDAAKMTVREPEGLSIESSGGIKISRPDQPEWELVNTLDTLRNDFILETFRRMIDSAQGIEGFQDGWMDALVNEDNVDLPQCINQVYNDGSRCYQNYFSVSLGADTIFDDNTLSPSACAIAPNRFIFAYCDRTYKVIIKLGKLSGNETTLGPEILAYTSYTYYPNVKVCKLNDNLALITFIAYNGLHYLGTSIIEYSPITDDITFTTPVLAINVGGDSRTLDNIMAFEDSNTVAIVYRIYGSGVYMYTGVINYDLKTITLAAQNPVGMSSKSGFCRIDSAKILHTHWYTTTYLRAVVGTISGNTAISWGTPVDIKSDHYNEPTLPTSLAQIDTDKAIVCYSNNSDGYHRATLCVISVSGTTPSAGTSVFLDSNNYYYYTQRLNAFDTTHVGIAWLRAANNTIRYNLATISGTTISLGIPSGYLPITVGYIALDLIANHTMVIASSKYTSSFTGYFKVLAHTIAAADATIIFDAHEAAGEPSSSEAVLIVEPIDALTSNTDFKAWASLDNGANYEQITLSDHGIFDSTNKRIYLGKEALTDRNDQTTRLKITSHNTKRFKLFCIANPIKIQ